MMSFTVEFRIEGQDLDPTLVSNTLNLTPCSVYFQGSARTSRGRVRHPLWSFSGKTNDECEWINLSEGMESVVLALLPIKDLLDKVVMGHSAYWWIGQFSSGPDATAAIDAEVLSLVGRLGYPMYFTSYQLT